MTPQAIFLKHLIAAVKKDNSMTANFVINVHLTNNFSSP